MTKMINLKINNVAVSVPEGTTILDAANSIGLKIPTLCYLREINAIGACRICLVEVKGARGYATSCVLPVSEGMEVTTNSPKLIKARKTTLELLLSDHDKKCTSCPRSTNCELQKLSYEYGCEDDKFSGAKLKHDVDNSTCFIKRDNNKCILCRRCVAVCNKVQSVGVVGANNRGFTTSIGCAFENELNNAKCVACGQCIIACPTGALSEVDDTFKVSQALASGKHVVFGTAPAVRVALGEEFGMPIGTNVEGKLVAALRRLGGAKVFDVDFAADVTIMEEGTEFLNRLSHNGVLPMITSCSPGWIRYIEHYYPELIPHLSTCKSPQQMLGALIKTYYANKFNIDPKEIYVVSVMPCVAKKYEITREHQNAANVPDIDAVLTTRELARLIKRSGIEFNQLPNEEFDSPLGISSTAGLIFGATGGVMEAALRTVAEVVTKKPLAKLDFVDVRGSKGIKEAEYDLNGTKVKVAVVHSIANAKKMMELIKKGKADYHFIEIMTCPGGCIDGGGQPIHCASELNNKDIKALRTNALYSADEKSKLRKSHESPVVKELYAEFLGSPNSHKAHELLHTKYKERK